MMGFQEEATEHIPVMMTEILEHSLVRPGCKIIDGTLGGGGHALELLKRAQPGGMLLGVDWDDEVLENTRQRFAAYSDCTRFHHGNFAELDIFMNREGWDSADIICLDLGLSSFHLDGKIAAERGFGFNVEAPLDMRFDKRLRHTAEYFVNRLPQEELEQVFSEYGEERFSGRIARIICETRQKKRLSTTAELADLVRRAYPAACRHKSRIDPATRVFQALRILVNDELNSLENGLSRAVAALAGGGRLLVIAFHSLEDRIVKVAFKDFALKGLGVIITKKPLAPSDAEMELNRRSRSAKLRVFERSRK